MLAHKLLIGMSVLAFAAAAAAQSNNRSEISQSGPGNSTNVSNNVPGNDDNVSTIIQNGSTNSATVEQLGDLNVSRIRQIGDLNEATHRQRGNRNASDSDQSGNGHQSTIAQQGDDNKGTVTQSGGNRNSSAIQQGVPSPEASQPIDAQRNAARVQQIGSDNQSQILQQPQQGINGPVSGIAIFDNSATVVQGTGSVAAHGSSGAILQQSRGNFAEIFMFEGSTAARNRSVVRQTHGSPGDQSLSGNRASVAIRGYGNVGTVDQIGRNNSAEVTLQGGGTAAGAAGDGESGRGQGNVAEVQQAGTGLTAWIVGGSAARSEGQGNLSGSAQSGDSHHLEVWQRGLYDNATAIQGNGSQSANITYSNGAKARAFASISQRGERGGIQLWQYGDVSAELTQGLGARGGILVYQVDAGDFTTSSTATDPVNRARNSVGIAQYGDSQAAIVRQFALNASATLFQEAGPSSARSRNNWALVEQGMADVATIAAGSGSESFFGSGPSGQSGANSRNLVASIAQGNGAAAVSHNRASVRQDGVNLAATVQQSGNGLSDAPNRVEIAQRGNDNRASAVQRPGVGPAPAAGPPSGQSGDEFYFGGGRRSAEIVILQKSAGNSASVEQHGLGQLARIEQSGMRNSAAIVQEAGATNATAVIRQSGNDNSYTIAQTAAGHYLVVEQTGNNNAVTNIVQRPGG